MRISISYRTLLITVGVLVVLVGGYLLFDWLTVTDAERIHDLLVSATQAAERHDVDFLVDECLHKDFALGKYDREGLRKWGKEVLTRFKITSLREYDSNITITGDKADAVVKVFAEGDMLPKRNVRLDWELDLVRTEENTWKIHGMEVYYFMGKDRLPVPLETVMKYAGSP